MSLEESINAREKMNELVAIINTKNICDVGEFIGLLTENEMRWMLKMIAYGDWKKFE